MPNFEKIKGYKKQVEVLKSISDFLNNTDKYVDFGVNLPKGLIIYGEAGTGKSLMINSLIESCGRNNYYFEGNINPVREIKNLFKKAKKHSPSIIFFDDIDSLADSNDEYYIKCICEEIDDTENGEVFVLATARFIDAVPKYLLRANRISIKMELKAPELEDTYEVFSPIFANKKLADDFSLSDLCCLVSGWTYPTVERIYNTAAMEAVFEGRDAVSMRHIVKAGLKNANTILADKYEPYAAYHEAGHAAVQLLLGGEIGFVVLSENGEGWIKEKKYDISTYKNRERRYTMLIAGKISEEMFVGTRAVGSMSDLESMSNGIENDITLLATHGLEFYDSTSYKSNEYDDMSAKKIQCEMQRYADNAKTLLEQNKQLVIAIAEALKAKYYLLSSEVHKIFDDYMSEKTGEEAFIKKGA